MMSKYGYKVAIAFFLCMVIAPFGKGQNIASWKEKLKRYYTSADWHWSDTLHASHRQYLIRLALGGVNDAYISPIAHRGPEVVFMVLGDDPLKSAVLQGLYSEFMVGGGLYANPTNKSQLYSASMNGAIGPMWRLMRKPSFALDLGPMWGIDANALLKMSNSNNIFNLHLSTGIDIAVRAVYAPQCKSFPFRVHWTNRLQLMRVGFAPRFGQAYYDYVSGENRGKIGVYLSHPFNCWGITSRCLVDLPIRGSDLTVGVEYQHLYNKAPDNPYQTGRIGLVLGCSFDIFTLSGYHQRSAKPWVNTFEP